MKKRVERSPRSMSPSSADASKQSIGPVRSGSISSTHTTPTVIPWPLSDSSRLGQGDKLKKRDQQFAFPSSGYRGTSVQQHTKQRPTSTPPNLDHSYSRSCELCQILLTTYGLPHCFDTESMHQAYVRHQTMLPTEQQLYAEDMTSPFSVSYVSIAGRIVSTLKGDH
jgi:hypothetical protein